VWTSSTAGVFYDLFLPIGVSAVPASDLVNMSKATHTNIIVI
jgi:hypothetical protein